MSPRTAPTRTASLSPIDGLLLARAGASLQPHTNQRRPATPWQNAKKGLQHALRRRGLSPVAPLAQTAPSALVWVGVEGVGQLGGRVAREVERDSRCHSQGHTHPHWALGEPVNDCSSVLLTFYCTTYVSSIDGLVLVRVGASLKPHTRRHSLLRRGLARGALKAGLTPQ